MRHLTAVIASVIGFGAVVASGPLVAGDSQVPGGPIEKLQVTRANTNIPLPIGIEADVYCSGWIGDMEESFPGSIRSAEYVDSQYSFTSGDIVYLDIGSDRGAAPGQEYWIVRPGEPVNEHGSVSRYAGRMYSTSGRVRIICVQEESAIAEITFACADTILGDKILPFEPIPVPLVRRTKPYTSCDPPSGKVGGHIIAARDGVVPIGTETIVFLDLGEDDGLNPGDFLTVYRGRADVAGLRTILGEAAVLMTRGRNCVAKITWMRDVMETGDSVELK